MKKSIFRLLKQPFFGRFMVQWRNPLDMDFTWLKDSIKSKTGANIVVWSHRSQNSIGTVVLAHAMGKGAKGDFLKTGYANHLIRSGFNVVTFDFNGFGESTMGNFNYYFDLFGVRDYALQKFPGRPLFLHGISFGANWGTLALKEEDNSFEAAILESGATNLPEFWIHYPLAHKLLKAFYFFQPRYERKADFERCLSSTKNCKEILFLVAEPDIYTPLSMAERMQASANILSRILVFHKADHALSIKSDPERYMRETTAFFTKHARRQKEEKAMALMS